MVIISKVVAIIVVLIVVIIMVVIVVIRYLGGTLEKSAEDKFRSP